MHEGAYRYFARLINGFGDSVRDATNDAVDFEDCAGNARQSGNASIMQPDFLLKLEDRLNGFLVGEIAYSLPLSDGHQRAQLLLELQDIRAVIVINIRYPWNVTADGHHYDPEDGNLLFCYYRRDGPRDPERNEIIPDRVISFGNTPITAAEMATVHQVTHIPVDQIEGVGVVPGLECNQASRNLPVFVHEVPPEVVLIANIGDEVTMTNHPIDAVPEGLQFVVRLFDLKHSIRRGSIQMNRMVDTGSIAIPNFPGYRL